MFPSRLSLSRLYTRDFWVWFVVLRLIQLNFFSSPICVNIGGFSIPQINSFYPNLLQKDINCWQCAQILYSDLWYKSRSNYKEFCHFFLHERFNFFFFFFFCCICFLFLILFCFWGFFLGGVFGFVFFFWLFLWLILRRFFCNRTEAKFKRKPKIKSRSFKKVNWKSVHLVVIVLSSFILKNFMAKM